MARKQRKIYGHIKCTDCGTLTDINRQQDEGGNAADHGRFYWNCKHNRVCLAHHRFSPGIVDVRDVPGYIPLPDGPADDAAPIRNVTEPGKPVTNTAPVEVAKPEQKGGGDGIGWW